MRFSYERFNRRFGGLISLGLGVLTLLMVRRGLSYAPIAVGLVVLAWTLWAGLGRLIPVRPDRHSLLLRLASAAGQSLVVGLYQNVLFYLLPIWFGSATWSSLNIIFPCILAAMAVFSCFEYPYRAMVLDRPVVRTLWTAIIMFALLVPAATLIVVLPLRAYIALSAGLSALLSAGALMPRPLNPRAWLRVALLLVAALTITALMTIAALPPVPLVCLKQAAGTAVVAREVVGVGSVFPPGTERVYAHFAVVAPPRFAQEVRFQWFHNGEAVGQPIPGEVTGGRAMGYRTWSWKTRPAPGAWRADLLTADGQLIGRVRFEVK